MATIVANSHMAMIFDESQPKYKCCCGCMSVRTGTAIIATLKMFGVIMAVLELFTGPHFLAVFPQRDDDGLIYGKSTTSDPLEISKIDQDNDDGIGQGNAFGAVRFASTSIYLLVEAVAVSCLFYALRRERPKFVIPEMALIMICMSLELVVAVLVIIGASFGSEALVQMVINRMQAQGSDVTAADIEQIRRLIPFVLTAFAFALILGAAMEFWFFRTLKAYYGYLRDKMLFRTLCGDVVEIQHHCYVKGYQPMVEESGTGEDGMFPKDIPPAYNDVVKQQDEQAEALATQPPAYKELAQGPSTKVNDEK